jgi:parafibromin
MGNVHSFLEKGAYTEDGKDTNQPIQVKHKMAGREVTFDVYDSVTGFSASKWRRVVCVICSGHEWQFKDWKPMQGSGTELSKKELFARVRGYYLTYSDVKVPAIVGTWNVQKLQLTRNKRHHDVNEMTKFWQDLEVFLKRERFRGSDW